MILRPMIVFGAFLGVFQKTLFRPILGLFSAMSASSGGPNSRQIVEMCRKTLFPSLLDLSQCVKTDNNIEKVPFHRSFLGRILASVFGDFRGGYLRKFLKVGVFKLVKNEFCHLTKYHNIDIRNSHNLAK